MSVMVRLCTEGGLPVFEIFFLSTLASFFCMLGWAIYTKGKWLRIKTAWLYIFRALLGTLALILWFYTLKMIPLTEATAINYTWPLFAAIAAVFILHEPLDLRRIVALIVGFLGVVIIIRPGLEIVKLGVVVGILASALGAVVDIITKIQTRVELLSTQTFYISLFMSIASMPMAALSWQFTHSKPVDFIGYFGACFSV